MIALKVPLRPLVGGGGKAILCEDIIQPPQNPAEGDLAEIEISLQELVHSFIDIKRRDASSAQ